MAVDYDTVKKRKYFGQVSYEYERAGAFEEGRLISREWWKKDVEIDEREISELKTQISEVKNQLQKLGVRF